MTGREPWPFAPLGVRGRSVDAAVRERLAGSLGALFERLLTIVPHDPEAAASLVAAVRTGPVRPAVFAFYTDLVESLSARDERRARRCLDRLLTMQPASDEPRIVTLTEADLGIDAPELYARLIDDDPTQKMTVAPATDRPSAVDAVTAALAMIDRCAPEMGAEICALAREIVAAEPAADPPSGGIRNFDGATTFYLWGAVFVNPVQRTTTDLAQTLAHETGHLLLFGMAEGRPLVENPADERYGSPLRRDPRPMEGIVHAAYVIARMHFFLDAALAAGVLPPEGRAAAEAERARYTEAFFDALATIDRHARFTELGDAIFRGAVDYAVDYMTAASAQPPAIAVRA